MKSSFALIPAHRDRSPAIDLTGFIERENNRLEISYGLSGTAQIIVPVMASKPIRQFDLWEHTCFEFFLGIKSTAKYWEFNLSPAGHWNVFRFLKYRHEIAEEMAFQNLPMKVSRSDNELQLNLEINLDSIIAPEQSLDIGITAVIEDRQKNLSYWALTHPKPEADFHNRDSFIINL